MAASLEVPDDWGLRSKVAVVMGGGAAGAGIGNGRAAAILLARAGTKVIVVDRALDLAASLSGAGVCRSVARASGPVPGAAIVSAAR